MKPALLCLTVAGSLAGGVLLTSSPAEAAGGAIKAKYTCNKGQSLKVVFKGSKATVTPKSGKPVTLTESMTADGFLYANSKYSLRGRGNKATWSVGRRKFSCTAPR